MPPPPPPKPLLAVGLPSVLAAMARMSIKPEPSVVAGPADAAGLVAALGIASDCRFDSENNTEFSWRCPVKLSTRPPSCPGPAAPEEGQRDSSGAWAAGDANRSPPPPRAGAPKTSLLPAEAPPPKTELRAPDGRRARSAPLAG